MLWQTVLDVIDAVESWVAGQSYWIQVVLLLGILGPLCYLAAGFIDRMVEAVLAWHSRRDPVARSRQASPPQVATRTGVSGAASTPTAAE